MRQPIMDYLGSLNTLIAVFVGAILATGGALVAEIIQDRRNRKRRERDAARFFGDILISIDQVLNFAFRSQTIGDRWGNVTMRLFQTAIKEANVYERNRERLFDIGDMGLRGRIHTHFLTEMFPIEALIESSQDIEKLKDIQNGGAKLSKSQKAANAVRITELSEAREVGLEALLREHAKTDDICTSLEKLAGVKFSSMFTQDDITQPFTPADKDGA